MLVIPANFPFLLSMLFNHSFDGAGGSVNVILASRKIYTPLLDSPTKIREDGEEIFVRAKGQHQEDTLDSCQPSQADWIRQYLERQEGVGEFEA